MAYRLSPRVGRRSERDLTCSEGLDFRSLSIVIGAYSSLGNVLCRKSRVSAYRLGKVQEPSYAILLAMRVLVTEPCQ